MSRHYLCSILLLFLSTTSSTQAGGFVNRIGAGTQYGGIAGWQGSYQFGANAARFSVGITGIALGYERFFGSNNSLVIQTFGNQFLIGGVGLSYNYHLNSHTQAGWVVGLDLYSAYGTDDLTHEFFSFALSSVFSVFSDDELEEFDPDRSLGVLISVGYRF